MISLQKLFESPDSVRFGKLILQWSDRDARPFGYYNGVLLIGKRNTIHGKELVGKMFGDIISRHDFKYPGRLWIDRKIISFWVYPKTKREFIKFTKDLKSISDLDIMSSGWKIELMIKYLEDGEEQIEYEVIPIKEYLKSFSDYGTAQIDIDHVKSPMQKLNKRVPTGFGSKKGYQTWEFQKKFTSENKTMKTLQDSLNESLNESYKDAFIKLSNQKKHLFELPDNAAKQVAKLLKVKESELNVIKYDLDEISTDLSQDFHDLLTRNIKSIKKVKLDDDWTAELVKVKEDKYIEFDAVFADMDDEFTVVIVKSSDIDKLNKELKSYERR